MLEYRFRTAIIGKEHWKQWEIARNAIIYHGKTTTQAMPGHFSFKEILEYAKRKTKSHKGKQISRGINPDDDEEAIRLAAEKDAKIACSPLLNTIRNPNCSYYVPFMNLQDKLAAKRAANAGLRGAERASARAIADENPQNDRPDQFVQGIEDDMENARNSAIQG